MIIPLFNYVQNHKFKVIWGVLLCLDVCIARLCCFAIVYCLAVLCIYCSGLRPDNPSPKVLEYSAGSDKFLGQQLTKWSLLVLEEASL